MTIGKKNGRIRRLVLTALVTALLCAACASFAQADNKGFKILPDTLYYGETGEIHIKPVNAKYSIEKADAKEAGFKVTKSSIPNVCYIRSGGKRKVNATLKGTVNSKKVSVKVKIISPKFTLGGETGKSIYNVKLDDFSVLRLECNAQKPVRWAVENRDIVQLRRDDDWGKDENTNAVKVYGLKQGKTTVTASYMGHKYSVAIQVAPYIPDKSDIQHYMRYLLRTDKRLWKTKFQEYLRTGKIT